VGRHRRMRTQENTLVRFHGDRGVGATARAGAHENLLVQFCGDRGVSPPPRMRAQENTLVQFRGDAMHGFDPFQSESGLPRISLVVRSYKIATADYPFTPDFHVPADGT
jgi:hypothetical protein